MDLKTGAPTLQTLQSLQLFRTTLVNFVDWRNFSEVVTGCYVRVLLEMRNDDQRRDSNDHYYITSVKGAKMGPKYSGFSADAATTELHIIIDLPPCFRSTPNGNVVQFNSISNSPFRFNEYEQWVEMTVEAKQSFPSLPQLQFRIGMLQEQKLQSLKPGPVQHRKDEDPKLVQQREREMNAKRMAIEQNIVATHVRVPRIEELKTKDLVKLQELESEMLDLISAIRVAINERSKCMLCHKRVCTMICYPCKHQVLCRDCIADIRGRCPVPGCDIPVAETFECYSS